MTKILQVNFGAKHAEYKDKLQGIGERLEIGGVQNLRDPKRGGISLAAVIRHLIDNHVRLWETTANHLDVLIEAGDGKVSKADIINWAILNFDEADVRVQAALETISDNEFAEQFADDE